MKNLLDLHMFFGERTSQISDFKYKGWMKSFFYITYLCLFSSKKKCDIKNNKNISIILPLTLSPQIIITLNNNKYHKELYRYLGWYSSFFLKLTIRVIRVFGFPLYLREMFSVNNNDFNFILNTNNKLILFENENRRGIYLQKYFKDNKTLNNFFSREKYLKGELFNVNKDTQIIMEYFFSKKRNVLEGEKENNSLILNTFSRNRHLTDKIINTFTGYFEHGDLVVSNFRFESNNILIYDVEDSVSNGFYFTDISTFIFSYFSGEPNFNKVWIVKLMFIYKKKWFLSLVENISVKFNITTEDVLLLIYLGLLRKVELEKSGESNNEFWYEISKVYLKFLTKKIKLPL